MDTLSSSLPPDGVAAMGARTGASPIRRIIFNLPELMLINLLLWALVAAAIWATGTVLHVSAWGFVLPALVFGTPGIWATWQTLRLALAPIE